MSRTCHTDAQHRWIKESLRPKVFPQEALDIAYNRYSVPAVPNTTDINYGLGVVQIGPEGSRISSHGGAVPGHNSAFVRDVARGDGVFVILNQDPYGFFVADALAGQVLGALKGEPIQDVNEALARSVFGLPPVNATESESQGESEGADASANDEPTGSPGGSPGGPTLLPDNPAPIPDTVDLNGTFIAPGYSPLVFEPINMSDPAAILSVGLSPRILTQAEGLNIVDTAYVARWNASFTTHVVLTHFDGPHFNFTLLTSLAKIGELDDQGAVVDEWNEDEQQQQQQEENGDVWTYKLFGVGGAVVDDEGVGMFGTWWGNDALGWPEVDVEDVRGSAQAYFARQ